MTLTTARANALVYKLEEHLNDAADALLGKAPPKYTTGHEYDPVGLAMMMLAVRQMTAYTASSYAFNSGVGITATAGDGQLTIAVDDVTTGGTGTEAQQKWTLEVFAPNGSLAYYSQRTLTSSEQTNDSYSQVATGLENGVEYTARVYVVDTDSDVTDPLVVTGTPTG